VKIGRNCVPLFLALGLVACQGPKPAAVDGDGPAAATSAKAEPAGGARTPEWADHAVMYEVNIRQYTKEGTFNAFRTHLPRLKELGVDLLWLMPVHPISKTKRNGTLGSYYAVDDYKAVNPEFGTAGEFKALVEEAHRLGFKVMLDWVANHTGWDQEWTRNPGWHTTDEAGAIVQPPGTNWTDVADLNYDNSDMQAAMIDAMKYWVEEYDIDGYRCDYAGGVPVAFWEKAREELGKIKPVFMLAEDDQQISLLRRAFNANYGWALSNAMKRVAKGIGNAEQIMRYAERLDKTYPSGTYPLHFTSNHDENSWEGTEFERLGEAAKAMAALTFALPGMPLIYSGQEAGFDKRLAFFEKDEIEWSESPMRQLYADLIRLKHDNPALGNGGAGAPVRSLESGNDHLLAFVRAKEGNAVVFLANLSAAPVRVEVGFGAAAGSYVEFPAGTATELQPSRTFELEPWEYRIYARSN